MCLEANPDYIAQKAEQQRKWQEEIEPFMMESLETMRGFVPPNIMHVSREKFVQESGYSTSLVRRILERKCLWLVRMSPEDICRVHIADLMGR